MIEKLKAALAALLDKRAEADAKRTALLAVVEARTENPEFTDAEVAEAKELRGQLVAIDAEITTARAALDEAVDDDVRATRAAEARKALGIATVTVTSEPETYRKGGQASYFRDLTIASLRGNAAAMERLERNDREVRALTTTDGGVGEFVPPLWMVAEFVRLARSGRVVADQLSPQALPAGTDTINLPRLTGGTAVAVQSTQNTAVQNTDATSDSVSAAVQTVAGQQVVSVQLLEQSPINMDGILLNDLARDYNSKLDVAVINGTVTNAKGLLNVVGINAVTYTDGTPTAGELYPKVADAIQRIHTGRFEAPNKILMHPRRWAFMLASLDSNGRPLIVPDASGQAFNTLAGQGGVVAQGYVGTMQGLPVFVDANIPTTLGGGTEDRIIILNSMDTLLFEGSPRAEAFRETKADQLSVLLRLYNYYAIHASRLPLSISVISGTGLVTPTF